MLIEKTKPKLKEGYLARPAIMEDLDGVVEMLNAFSLATIGVADFTAAEIKNDWEAPKFDMEKDTLVTYSPSGQVAAYQEAWTAAEVPVHPWVWGRVHPEHEGQGLGTHQLVWAEARVREAIDRVPPEARVAMWAGTLSTHEPSRQLLEDMGMTIIRHSFQMRIEMDKAPPKPEWPEGIRVRKYNPDEDAEAVYRADDEAFKDHFGYVEEPFEEGFKHFMHYMTKDEGYDPDLWFLAMDGDEIAGISLCRKWSWEDKDTGWVSSLGVRRPWRKRGLGLALLQQSFNAFYERGQRKAGLGVDASNLTGAVRLYEKAGMYVHRRYDRYEKELRPGVELATTSVKD